MKFFKKLRSNLTVNMVGAIVLFLVIFGIVVSLIGFLRFQYAFQNEYSETTYHMARTAAAQINGDNIDAYLAGEEVQEFSETNLFLNNYCKNMHVMIVYVIKVDTTDYAHFKSIFNLVDNSVDNTNYTPWKLGFERETTNEEYRLKYEKLYNKESNFETVYRYDSKGGHHPHITTIVPVKDSTGKVVSLLCIQRPMSELNNITRPYIRIISVGTVVLILLITLFVATFIRKQFVTPVRKVSNEASRFAAENTKGKPLAGISRYTEIAKLASSIDTMETDMVNYIDNLTTVTAERERIGAELTLASAIQENSIPNVFPAFPDRDEFDIFASMTPAKEVGGDFYNFFFIDEDHLAVVIGDVSGKGIPGALFMMVTNIIMNIKAKMGGTPGEIMTYVNNRICENNKFDMFVTLWLGILEVSTGKITFANAGHDDPAVYRKDGVFDLFKTKHDIVVGAMQGIKFRDFEMQLGHGDKLFIYTDGVPEATDANLEMYTLDRMIVALNEYKEKTPKEILEGVHNSVNEFVGDAPQFDDLTMLGLEYK